MKIREIEVGQNVWMKEDFEKMLNTEYKKIIDNKPTGCYRAIFDKQQSSVKIVDYQDQKDFYTPLRIIYNNPATIVFWRDGTKTIVKKNDKEKYNSYNAFCAALAKKIYGTNSEVNRIVRNGYNQKVAEGQKKFADFKKKVEKARKEKKKGEKK